MVISGVANVYSFGNLALKGADIVSNMNGMKEMNVILNGTNVLEWYDDNDDKPVIHCNATDTCNIVCASSEACTDVILNCQGNCTVTGDGASALLPSYESTISTTEFEDSDDVLSSLKFQWALLAHVSIFSIVVGQWL